MGGRINGGWSVAHFHDRYREQAPVEGLLVHQDGSTYEWVAGECLDLTVTLSRG